MEGDECLKKVKALKNLSRAKTNHASCQRELNAIGDDRGYCLLVVSIPENNLDEVIDRHIVDFNKEDLRRILRRQRGGRLALMRDAIRGLQMTRCALIQCAWNV
jgi:hypothetical protein